MALVLDTRTLPSEDRADAVRETIASTVVDVNIDFSTASDSADVYGRITDLGHMRVCSVHSNAVRVERTPRLAGDASAPRIFLALQMTGTSLIVQDGREAVLNPGELAFSDSTTPYTLLDAGGIRQHFFSISVAALGLPQDAIRSLSATTLSPKDPLADLAATYLGRIAARGDIFTHPSADSIGQPSIDLVRALLASHLDAPTLSRDPLRDTRALRILEYARAHLHEPELHAPQVAAAHNVSLRQLYLIMSDAGISLGDWVRDRRLEACRAELSRPNDRPMEIGRLARRWGFRDPSSFGRAFKSAYGMTPTEWRRSQLGGKDL